MKSKLNKEKEIREAIEYFFQVYSENEYGDLEAMRTDDKYYTGKLIQYIVDESKLCNVPVKMGWFK